MENLPGEQLMEHLERYLGPLHFGWPGKEFGLDFSILEFENQPCEGARTYVSFGLSKHMLLTKSGNTAFQEVVFSVWAPLPEDSLPEIAAVAAKYLLDGHQGVQRGEIIGPASPIPRCPLREGNPLRAFYLTWPTYFADEFAAARVGGKTVNLCWAIPITENEAVCAEQIGWSEFENLLVEQDPDLMDLLRQELCLPIGT